MNSNSSQEVDYTVSSLKRRSVEISNNFSREVDQAREEATREALGHDLDAAIFTCCLVLVGTVGNSILLDVYRHVSRKILSTYFVIALASIDLSISAVILPTRIVLFYVAVPKEVCGFQLSVAYTAVSASIMLFILIAFDRFQSVCLLTKPFITLKHVKYLVIWAFAGSVYAAVIAPLFLTGEVTLAKDGESVSVMMRKDHPCYINSLLSHPYRSWDQRYIVHFIFAVSNVVIIVFVTVLYLLIFRTLRQTDKFRHKSRNAVGPMPASRPVERKLTARPCIPDNIQAIAAEIESSFNVDSSHVQAEIEPGTDRTQISHLRQGSTSVVEDQFQNYQEHFQNHHEHFQNHSPASFYSARHFSPEPVSVIGVGDADAEKEVSKSSILGSQLDGQRSSPSMLYTHATDGDLYYTYGLHTGDSATNGGMHNKLYGLDTAGSACDYPQHSSPDSEDEFACQHKDLNVLRQKALDVKAFFTDSIDSDSHPADMDSDIENFQSFSLKDLSDMNASTPRVFPSSDTGLVETRREKLSLPGDFSYYFKSEKPTRQNKSRDNPQNFKSHPLSTNKPVITKRMSIFELENYHYNTHSDMIDFKVRQYKHGKRKCPFAHRLNFSVPVDDSYPNNYANKFINKISLKTDISDKRKSASLSQNNKTDHSIFTVDANNLPNGQSYTSSYSKGQTKHSNKQQQRQLREQVLSRLTEGNKEQTPNVFTNGSTKERTPSKFTKGKTNEQTPSAFTKGKMQSYYNPNTWNMSTRISLRLFLVTLAYCLCWLPFYLVELGVVRYRNVLLHVFFMANVMNPVIHFMTSTMFRAEAAARVVKFVQRFE